MRELHGEPFVFQGKGVSSRCYGHDLLVFANFEQKVDELHRKMSGVLIMKDLGTPKPIL